MSSFSEVNKTMVLFSYAEDAAEDMEEKEKTLALKPIVLPPITMTLKRVWKANRENLEKAGIFDFLCWVQSATRVAYVEQATQFLQTYTPATGTAQVDDRAVDFSMQVVARYLKLPMNGMKLEEMPGLNKKQYEDMFEGDFVRTPKGCSLEKAKHHWRLWLRFINDYLIFRPKKDMITQQVVAAAMNTWNGKRVNWAQIVYQKTVEEIQRYREGEPKTREVYSAFYISIFCRTLPQRVVASESPTSSIPTPSPLSSPEKVMEEVVDLRRQLEQCKNSLQEKRTQLIEKTEALIKCQTANVKHIYELAQAMKEKVADQVTIEGHLKAIDMLHTQVAEKEKENVGLRQQLNQWERQPKQVNEDHARAEQLTQENESLKRELQVRGEELNQYKAKVEQLTAKGQSSTTATGFKAVLPFPSSSEFFSQLWSWETRGPEPKGIFQMYELQSQLFFLMTELKKFDWINHTMFQQIWNQSVQWGVENLLAEILARRHLNLSDPHSAFIVLGDLGARVLLYYAALETQWVLRHQYPLEVKKREASWQDYSPQVSTQFYSQPIASICQWQEVLKTLLIQVKQPDFITDVLAANLQRQTFSASKDVLGSHYLYQHDRVGNRLERYLREVDNQKKPLLNLNGQVQFEPPPVDFVPSQQLIDLPVNGSQLTLRYLGQYGNMFDSPTEEPIPTWDAIAWILEDYGQSRTEDMPADIYYRRVSRQWPSEPPVNVRSHPHFCPCPRRCKWDPVATISSVEYNWPLVPGPKSTAEECRVTYRQFFQDHILHRDPVCYRAAVFANILSNWCGQWNVTIDVNRYHESHHEFLLLLKLQYRPTRWVRLVEAMALTHFIAGAHKCLINEFPYTRAGPFERFLRWQRLHAPELVARDEDLQKAIEKSENRELKREAEEAAQHQRPPPKLLRC